MPAGFVITTKAFEKFIADTGLDTEIDAVLDSIDVHAMHTVELASERIQALIERYDLPKEIESEIIQSHKALQSKYVAVRSSSTAEDGAVAAWAGQLETYLNTTKKTLINHVKKCWASLFSPRAIFYRFEKKFHKQKLSVAVVVQAMIESEKSGIAFSVHPVTQNRNQMIIEAGFGLGDAIVSGSITPDSYVLRKDDWKIVDKQIQTQKRGLYRAKGGNSEWKALPVSKGKKPTLSDEEVTALAKMIVRIERHYGFPVDVEWAMVGGQLFILQSRAITTLDSKTLDSALFDSSKDWVPYLTRPFSLFGASLWQSWYDSDLIKKLLGVYFPSALFIEEHKNVVRLYREDADLSAFKAAIKNIVKTKEKYLRSIFLRGFELNDEALAYIHGKKKCTDFGVAVRFMIELALHATVIPNFALPLIIEMQKDSKLKKFGEDLRGKSHYPKFISHVLMPLAQKKLRQLKIADVKDAVELITLQELLSGSVQELPNRIKAREKLKQRFVYQKTDKGETVQWVSDPLPLIAELENIDLGGNKGLKRLKGQVAFKGKVRGIARVVLTDNVNVKFNKGDILVSIHSSPTLMPLILRCSAIVTDEGGVSCHAAIVSRELKKPCVMSTKIATSLIKDGDKIEVDANRGEVRILKRIKAQTPKQD